MFYVNFCTVSFIRTQALHSPKNSPKIMTIAPHNNLRLQKIYQYHLCKQVHCMQNFVQFYAIESKLEISQEFSENRYRSTTLF